MGEYRARLRLDARIARSGLEVEVFDPETGAGVVCLTETEARVFLARLDRELVVLARMKLHGPRAAGKNKGAKP